jgi:DNA-binding NtrC family response regulator
VRAKVAKAGSPNVTAYLHATVAVAEGQAGRTKEAKRHLAIARRVAADKPHAWLQCSILGTSAAMSLADREFPEATEYLQQLQKLAHEHALNADAARANVNLGHLAMLTGRHSVAERALLDAMSSRHTSRIAKLTAAETLAEVRLIQGRLEDCERILHDIDKTAAETSLHNVFAVQWANLTHARLLVRRGEARAAIERLESLESTLRATSDRPLLAAARITTAQALVMGGDSARGAQYLLSSLMLDPAGLPDLQSRFLYSVASTVANDNSLLASALRARAHRVWASQGAAPLETNAEPAEPAAPSESAGRFPAQPIDNTVCIEALANLVGLGGNPLLLAHEVQELIRSLNCSSRIILTEGGTLFGANIGQAELTIPRKDSAPLRLLFDATSSTEQAIVLGAVVRVAQSAIELERLRDIEHRQGALWPDTLNDAPSGTVFDSAAMLEIVTVARRVAATSVPVLITGETGTGKEVLARLIHGYSDRAKASFVPFNCTSLSTDMGVSQLFGHRRGAFTGATDNSPGIIRAAQRGTLFLDEIGDMHIDVQPKLLRFLETGEIHPIGEPVPSKVDVRIIAATNADLRSHVSSGRFREDLYYRIGIIPLHLPPLRERRSEIPALANHYLEKYALEFNKGDLRLSDEAMAHLLLFRWKGNIRQLANEMRRVAVLAESGAVVMREHLSAEITASSNIKVTQPAGEHPKNGHVGVRIDQPLAAAVEHLERAMIVHALKRVDGAMERAAAILGLSRKGLYLKRQKYQIDADFDDTVARTD